MFSFIPSTYESQKFSRESLVRYQHANDIAEVLWCAGDYERAAGWVEGDEAAGYIVKERLGDIANEMGYCILLETEKEAAMITANCNRKEEGDVVSISRVIIGEKGVYEMKLSIH
ncbi:MAG: hypothetical protein ABIF01_03050 [Candidatus Micrarchaeota archaeon]